MIHEANAGGNLHSTTRSKMEKKKERRRPAPCVLYTVQVSEHGALESSVPQLTTKLSRFPPFLTGWKSREYVGVARRHSSVSQAGIPPLRWPADNGQGASRPSSDGASDGRST